MPAGASWPRYVAAITAAMFSMFAGAQTVHVLYHPLQDLESMVEREKELILMRKAKAEMEILAPASTPVSTNTST